MSKLPYFQFYPSDWLSSPRIMCATLAEQGAYIRLLCVCWMSGDCSIPADSRKLSILSGLPEQELDFIYQMFTQHPTKSGHLTNDRLLKEWGKAHWISESRAQAGKKSGKSRRTLVQQVFEQNTNKTRTFVDKSEVRSQKSEVIVQKSDSEIRSQNKEQDKKIKTCDEASPVAKVWESYATAYLAKYKTMPVRNAKVNGQLTQLVKRVGAVSAVRVAEFYVWHNDQFYVRARHPPGLLLRDCEGLHTQMVTGRSVTTSQARKIDETHGRVNVFQEIINERKGEAIDVETA